MAEDFIRYDILTQDALRGVVRKVLAEVARTGLPGEHHFYVSLSTTAPGVRISSRLLAKYPEEMTIVIQHQFWDLKVSEHSFEIGLSFDDVPERLLIPFSALKGFLDPSVQFGLQFERIAVDESVVPIETQASDNEGGMVEAGEAASAEKADAEHVEPGTSEEAVGTDADDSAEVVSLDAFRKK